MMVTARIDAGTASPDFGDNELHGASVGIAIGRAVDWFSCRADLGQVVRSDREEF